MTQFYHNTGPSRPRCFNTHETLDVIYSDLDLEVDLDDVYPDSDLESVGVGDESNLDLDNPRCKQCRIWRWASPFAIN